MDIDGHAESKKRKTSLEQEGAAKRKRVSRACDRCRIKKDKCDGQRPSCSACRALGQVCSYDPSTKKRGLPEGYVRGLEKLWAVSMGRIHGLEDAVTSIITQHELLEIWNHETVGEDLHSVWKESAVLRELEGMLARLESADSSAVGKRKRDKDDIIMDEVADSVFHRSPTYHIEGGPAPGDPEYESPLERHRALPPSTRKSDAAEIPLPSQTSMLIDAYFSFTHCWFPIVERHCILRTSYSHSQRVRSGKTDTADLAAVWAILAYTARQNIPSGAEEEKGQRKEDMTAEEMRVVARTLIPDENGPCAIGHVQALLLLVLLDIGLGKWSSAWLLAGQATRTALDLGCGTTSTEKRGLHVLYGCFLLDTLIANHLLRPPHLRRQDLEAAGYLDEDGYEEWDPWTSSQATSSYREPAFMISCFNRLLDIFLTLNDTLCDRRTGPAKSADFQLHAETLKILASRFPMFPGVHCPPHQLYLQLFHWSASILVLRQSFEGGEPSDELARLACEILLLLTKHAQDPTSGLAVVPPVLESTVRSACYAAIAVKPSFEQPGLPDYNVFARQMTALTLAMSAVWPVFSGLTKLWQTELQSHGARGGLGTTGSSGNGGNVDWQSPASAFQQQYSTSLIQRGISDAQGEPTLDLEGSDLPMSGMEQPGLSTSMEQQSMPAGLTMPASDPSPSFQGDDVDVIFHNLAYLDTTDWTNNRERGLREFGFSDESTFQDFCNDPERIVASQGTPFGLLANDASTTFWPPPGFFPGHFEEPDPQVEASQILQSLSNNGAYPTLPESVGW